MFTLSKHAPINRTTPTIILPHEENHGMTYRALINSNMPVKADSPGEL